MPGKKAPSRTVEDMGKRKPTHTWKSTTTTLKVANPDEIIMTKKEFEELASILKLMTHVPEEFRREMALHFSQYFQQKNDRFDIVRFMTACGFKNN